jgi:cobalt-zinc-cadmium efflux system protein
MTHAHHGCATQHRVQWAIMFNVLFIVVECWFAYRAHSVGLMADAVHNIGDVLSLVLLGLSQWMLTKKSTATFTYGYKKATLWVAFINCSFLLLTCGGILVESIKRLWETPVVNNTMVMYVAFIGVLVNLGSAWLFHANTHDDVNMRATFWHLVADGGVSLGVALAAWLVQWTHFPYWESIITWVITVAIVYSTWHLLVQTMYGLLDGVPRQLAQVVRQHLSDIPNVIDVHDMHLWRLSTQEYALTAHLVIPAGLLSKGHYDAICVQLKTLHVTHVTLQVDQASDCLQQC